MFNWEVENSSRAAWGIRDLYGARVNLRIMYLSYSDINLRRAPKLHNLHLYFGRETPHILCFTAQQLATPQTREDPEPIARWDFSAIGYSVREMLIEYSFEMTEELLASQLRQLG